MYLKITVHSAAAEEIIKNYITFLDPGGINCVIIVGPTVIRGIILGSLHEFHVIHCTWRNYTWKAGFLYVINGVGHST